MADLIQAAIEARERAYAPYSGYSVGAAILTEQGSIVTGGNVENISYGATICAERSAIVRMLAEGAGSKVCELAVASKDGVTPCGICLQVLQEFAASPQFKVHSVDQTGIVRSCKFQDLLPHPFDSPNVRRTEV